MIALQLDVFLLSTDDLFQPSSLSDPNKYQLSSASESILVQIVVTFVILLLSICFEIKGFEINSGV